MCNLYLLPQPIDFVSIDLWFVPSCVTVGYWPNHVIVDIAALVGLLLFTMPPRAPCIVIDGTLHPWEWTGKKQKEKFISLLRICIQVAGMGHLMPCDITN